MDNKIRPKYSQDIPLETQRQPKGDINLEPPANLAPPKVTGLSGEDKFDSSFTPIENAPVDLRKTEQQQKTKEPESKVLFDESSPTYQKNQVTFQNELRDVGEKTKNMTERQLNDYANSMKNSYESENKGLRNILTHAWRSIFGHGDHNAAKYREIKENETKNYKALRRQIREAPLTNFLKEQVSANTEDLSNTLQQGVNQNNVTNLANKLSNGQQILPSDIKGITLKDGLMAYNELFNKLKTEGKPLLGTPKQIVTSKNVDANRSVALGQFATAVSRMSDENRTRLISFLDLMSEIKGKTPNKQFDKLAQVFANELFGNSEIENPLNFLNWYIEGVSKLSSKK